MLSNIERRLKLGFWLLTGALKVNLIGETNAKNSAVNSPGIRETQDFASYLPVSKLEYEIFRIFTEDYHSVVDSPFRQLTFKYFALFELFYR